MWQQRREMLAKWNDIHERLCTVPFSPPWLHLWSGSLRTRQTQSHGRRCQTLRICSFKTALVIGPQMMWAHFVLPHPPVRLDRSCVPQRDAWRNGQALTFGASDDELRRAAYIEQLLCVNDEMIRQLRTILEARPDTSVFLFSDHGPDGSGQLTLPPSDLSTVQIRERLGILLAVRGDSCGVCAPMRARHCCHRPVPSRGVRLGLISNQSRSAHFLFPLKSRNAPTLETKPVGR